MGLAFSYQPETNAELHLLGQPQHWNPQHQECPGPSRPPPWEDTDPLSTPEKLMVSAPLDLAIWIREPGSQSQQCWVGVGHPHRPT